MALNQWIPDAAEDHRLLQEETKRVQQQLEETKLAYTVQSAEHQHLIQLYEQSTVERSSVLKVPGAAEVVI